MTNQKGFSMIEMICVLCLLSFLAYFIVPRFIKLDSNAEFKALNVGIETLNKLEKFQWSEYKLSSERYSDAEVDLIVSARVDTNIGDKYKWNGTTLSFGSASVTLERSPATNSSPAIWRKLNS